MDTEAFSVLEDGKKEFPFGESLSVLPRPVRHIFKTAVEDGLDLRLRKWGYLNKRFPKLMELEGDKVADWCERTGRDDADWWWQAMLEKYYPGRVGSSKR